MQHGAASTTETRHHHSRVAAECQWCEALQVRQASLVKVYHGETVPPVLPAVADCCCWDASSMSAAGGAKVDDVAGCDDAKTSSTSGGGGGRGRTLTAASTRSCGSAEISADWWDWPATAGASGGAGATGSLPSGRRTIRKVPSAWLKAMAPVPVSKVQVCQKSSVRTGMFSGTRSISLLKCLGPSDARRTNTDQGRACSSNKT